MNQVLKRVLLPIAPVIAFFVIWYCVITLFHIPNRVFPGPEAVLERIYNGLFKDADLWPHLSQTLQSTILGFLLGTLLAVVFGSVLAMYKRVELLMYPVVVVLQAVPKVAIAPLILLWLGYETKSTVVLVALICFFPIFVGTFVGIRATPPVLLDLFKSLNANSLKLYWHCCLPNAAGSILSGLQVGWGFALVGCVVMEFIVGMGGAGFLIDNSANSLDTTTAVTAMVLLGVLGYVGGALLTYAKEKLVFWEGSKRS